MFSQPAPSAPVVAAGKSLLADDRKLLVKGVTYGTFRSDSGFPPPDQVTRDFDAMAAHGINAIRTYTVPPRWLLDLAGQRGIYVMAGLPWEGHVAFLDSGRGGSIERRIRSGVAECREHDAVLCYSIGNEVPATLVRWQGTRRTERFLDRLVSAVKDEDPGALVTYANYPTTEYLELPSLDIVSFNVFLEGHEDFEAYVGRLQNLAGGRPLLLSELGLDSARNGQERQATVLAEQLQAAFAAGCAGTFAFAWTDEWHRGGHDVDDWDFGLVNRARQPKPALAAVREVYAAAPFSDRSDWPRVSVVVCTHNGEATLDECLQGLRGLDYPNYEVIVVDDGSTDKSAQIAAKTGYTVVSTEPRGLSAARNTGLEAATGEIVAYIDDDAWPDPHWLKHLVRTLETTGFEGVGGPNIPPPEDSLTAESIAVAPGGPNHVLLSDDEAEHIPGCNMAFRRSALRAIGGFDETFWTAGDDVDVCWRIHERGWRIGFSAGAVVFHRRRGSMRSYLRQQYEYGKAEGLLERKWPDRYNHTGHLTWSGHVYAPQRSLSRRWRIYYGTWGSEAFQPAEVRSRSLLLSLPLMPEWYLVISLLGALSAGGFLWGPLLAAVPLLAASVIALLVEATTNAARATAHANMSRRRRSVMTALVLVLHVVQPLARLCGRVRNGLSPWRRSRGPRAILPRAASGTIWSEDWRSPESWVAELQRRLSSLGASVFPGSAWDGWDLEVRGGLFAGVRLQLAVEEHGQGRQLVRWRYRPRLLRPAVFVTATIALLAAGAALDGAPAAAVLLGILATALSSALLVHAATAAGAAREAAESLDKVQDLPRPAVAEQIGTRASVRQPAVNGDLPVGLPSELAEETDDPRRALRR
jgi:O-antigen biosynthesis protein